MEEDVIMGTSMRNVAVASAASVLVILLLSTPCVAFAWDPSMSDLTGTNSSTNNSVGGANRRFDIDGSSSPTVYGMQTGEDSDSIAHLMKTSAIQSSISTVTTSTSDSGTYYPFQRKSFFANGRYWFFYYDLYYTSTDGSSWSEYSTGDYVDSVWYDGTYMHYVYGGAYLYYRRGTPNSDGTITWSASEQQVSTTYGEVWWPTISVDSNGYVWIGYADGYSTAYPFVIKSGNNDGTWGTTPSGFPYQLSSTPMNVVVPIPLTGGKVFVLYHANGGPVYGKRWTGSTWGSERGTASSADQFISAVGQDDDVHLVFNKSPSTSIIYEKYAYASDAWGTETDVTTIDSWDKYPVLCRDPSNNDLYVFWASYPTDDHIYYKRYSGGSWDANPTDWINEGTDTLTDNQGLNCFYLSYGSRIGLAYTTKASSPYNVRFACLPFNAFQVAGMSTNDQYDINFTIGGESFCMLFIATGSNSGTLKLFYKSTGAGSWSSGETFTQSNIASGTTYQSGSGYTGFKLTSSSSAADGSMKFIVKKSYLASLGASGSSITLVSSATFQSGTGNPGSGGATPNDRCPSTGSASWTYTPGTPTLLTFNSKYVVTSTTAATTTSSSLVDDTYASQGFSLTASQTVLVIYQANCLNGATMPATGMQNAINVDGADYANTWDSPYGANYPTRNTVFWIGTLASGSHTIKGRFASMSSGSTATVSNRILLIYILNGGTYYYLDDTTTQTTSSSSLQDDSSASFTFTPPGTCKALFLYNIANSGATESGYGKKAAINIGGTDYSQAEEATATDDCPDSIFTVWAMQLSASSTTVTGRFASNRVGCAVMANRRQLGVLMFADDTLLDALSSDSQVSTTSSMLVHDDYATISRTTTDARELLVVGMGTKRNNTQDSSYGECYGIMVDGIDRANSRGSCDYTSVTNGLSPSSMATAFAIYMSAGSHTIRGRFSNNYQTYAAKFDSRRIVALWLSTTAMSQAATNFAFTDGGSVSVGTGVTTIATLSTSSFDSGNNFVIAVVQFQSSSSTSIEAGNLKLARGGTTLMSNQYVMPISSSNPHNQKWFALMALDSGAPSNPTYFVNATAAATGISGEAKILAISGLTGASDQGSSILINGPSWPASTTLASLSTGLPAGDNVVLAIIESINDGDSAAQSISICRLYHKLGSMMTDAQYYMTHDQMANVGRWHAHLMPYLDIGASANAIYNVTCTATKANVIHGRATIVTFSVGSLSAAYIDGSSTSIGTSETIINKLNPNPPFQSGSDVAVIASEQFWNMDGSNYNSISADLNKLQQDNSSSGQATNQYAITTSLYGSADNGKGFGLLDRFTSGTSSQYEVKATKSSSYSYMGEAKILALCKPPKVPEFPLGPVLLLTIIFPIFFTVKKWKRT